MPTLNGKARTYLNPRDRSRIARMAASIATGRQLDRMESGPNPGRVYATYRPPADVALDAVAIALDIERELDSMVAPAPQPTGPANFDAMRRERDRLLEQLVDRDRLIDELQDELADLRGGGR